MRTYIELNTNMRKKAQNEFEKDFFKLMSNAPYGKFIENIRKRSNIELILNNNKRLLKCVSDPTYKRATTFHENLLVAVHKSERILKLNKPIIVGFWILELSKTHMYDFWYNTIKTRYGSPLFMIQLMLLRTGREFVQGY